MIKWTKRTVKGNLREAEATQTLAADKVGLILCVRCRPKAL